MGVCWPAFGQRRQQPPLPLRMAHSQVLPTPVEGCARTPWCAAPTAASPGFRITSSCARSWTPRPCRTRWWRFSRACASSSANYMVGHTRRAGGRRRGRVPGDHTQLHLLFAENGVLLHTNHFLADIGSARDIPPWSFPTVRSGSIACGASSGGSVVLARARSRALADHANYPNSICCHPDTRFTRPSNGRPSRR